MVFNTSSSWVHLSLIYTRSFQICCRSWSFLFQEPNPEDPLNKEAAIELQSNRRMFEQNVQKTMKGEWYLNNICCICDVSNWAISLFYRWQPQWCLLREMPKVILSPKFLVGWCPFFPTIPCNNLHWLNLVNKMPSVLSGFQESFSSVFKIIIEPASLLELWC